MRRVLIIIALISIFTLLGCQEKESIPEKENKEKEVVKSEPSKTTETKEINLPEDNLQKFDSGEAVKELNEFLDSLGYDVDISHEFNDLTTWALTDIQLQLTPEYVTGMYDELTKETLEKIKNNDETVTNEEALKKPEYTEELPDIVENPYEILALVNKQYALAHDYIPNDLVVPDVRFSFAEDDPKKQLRKVAAKALESLFDATNEADLELFAQSGYRSYDRQKSIFENNARKDGEELASTYSARPGESEHQTGLTMDVTSQAVNFALEIEFEETKEGEWLKETAHNYGFIIRYPKGKEEITEYQYEPWHLRYVGTELAKELHKNNETLEEYYERH